MSTPKPPKRILLLAQKWLNNTITASEKKEFDDWYNAFDDTVFDVDSPEGFQELGDEIHTKILSKINREHKRSSLKLWKTITIAATMILVFAGALLVYQKSKPQSETNQTATVNILPGKNQATLTLDNGKKIFLNDVVNGELAAAGNVKIVKIENGQLLYKVDGAKAQPGDTAAFNTIETPRGGQYQIALPDGTHVWLNAGSSLRFPVAFAAKNRMVKLQGEAYFEVAHNAKKPFLVSTEKQTVEVLGTHFNVNAYQGETFTKTTLLEGKVKVYRASANGAIKENSILFPGEQASLSKDHLVVKQVEAENEIAWKNGYFIFNGDDFETSMRTIGRWYNVEIICQGNFDDIVLGGTMSRSKKLDETLTVLSLTQKIKFRYEGRKVIATR
ncbi:FecR family protein [Pedobacter sp.]|uniref:FecR family protein n=1 Tax=Pedobacter sp. TaxID=1411316 RepID=UPI003BACCC68